MRQTLLILFLLAAAPLLLTAPVAPQDDPREIELAAIRQEIGDLTSRLTAMRGRESGLEGQVKQLSVELELQEAQLSEAAAAFALATSRSATTESEIDELVVALAELRQDLKRRLAGLYFLGRRGYLRLFLSLEPDSDVLPAIRQLRFLVRRDQTTMERYRATQEALAARRQRLVNQRREADLWRQREQARRDALADMRGRHQKMLDRVARERRNLVARTQELRDKERKLARLIASLERGALAPIEGQSIQEFRGALDWPLSGEVVTGFGPRKDPRYRTEVPHNGIDIQAGGAEVRSIFPGEVVFAAEFEGYGPMVVVHHPGRVFTLYAKLTEIRAAKGDMLSLGQILGTSAEILYFEIRLENQPQNPREWLR